ncbi:MAG: FAD-dependent oxidoreductase [Euryarchaeota archaeon]|jgi:NADH oxidase (H2O2-forming)|nr:FAD-dependent oxidoreductase [Euryarchaeota archaeon]
MKVIIIGGGAGGLSTASNIRKYDAKAKITVITRDKHVAYSPCAIPYVLSGDVKNFNDIIMHQPEEYLDRNITVLTEAEVLEVEKEQNKIRYILMNDKKRHERELEYDRLVIATGGAPFIPPVKGANLKGVFTIHTIDDGFKIKKWANKSQTAVVVGAGLIGLETAYGLKKMGLEVVVGELVSQIVPRLLDPDMARLVQNYLEKEGIRVILGNSIEQVMGTHKVEGVQIGNEIIKADLVIMATGIRPETHLAEYIGCELGKWAIKVNEKMETSIPGIYAVGDCVEVTDAITGHPTQSPLGSTAVRQAKIAAKNIAGQFAQAKPVLNATVAKIGELEFGAVGLTKTVAIYNGIFVISGKKRALTKARYYPGAKRIDVKMVCNLQGRIIGCQIVAEERVAERVDTMALAIAKKVTCNELVNMEFSYAPPVSMVIDPIILAAENACEKLKEIGE